MGGNYLAKTNGIGFSQICNDTNVDGICDKPYVIYRWSVFSDNTDYYPLTKK